MATARTAIATVVLLLTVAATAGPAGADGDARRAWSNACRHDAFTFCRLQALEYNVPGVRDCLIRNLDKVSDVCRGVIRAAHAEQSLAPTAPAPH